MPESIPGFLVWLAVALLLIFITHQLTKSREEKGRAAVREDSGNSEKRTRKNDLLKFLSTWENEIRLGIGIHGAVARTFDERKSELIRLTSISAGDYAAEFSAMAQAITDMRGGEVDKKNQEGGKYQFIGAEKLLGDGSIAGRFCRVQLNCTTTLA